MFYYLFDNIVWITKMGAIDQHIIEHVIGWKQVKDMFNYLKNLGGAVKSVIKLQKSIQKHNEIEKKLFGIKNVDNIKIASDDRVTDLVMKLI